MKKTIKILLMLLIIFCALGGLKSFATETLGTEEQVQWTDFSKAKIEVIVNGSRVDLNVSNITKLEGSIYYFYVSKGNTKPTIEDVLADGEVLSLDWENGFFEKYLELNQDSYLWIVERQHDPARPIDYIYNYVVEGYKLEKIDLPKYGDGFFATMINWENAQILMNIPWYYLDGEEESTKREMNIKIGKVTDNSILKKIKNNENEGWDELLKYSKSSKTIYNQTVMSNTYGYKVDKSLLKPSDVENGSYYYLYVEVDDQDGKYYSYETVTLAQANKEDDKYYLFFIDDNDFEWNIEEEKEKEEVIEEEVEEEEIEEAEDEEVEEEEEDEDDTTADGDIPYTGVNKKVIAIIAFISVIGTVAYIKNRDLRGIE